MAAVAENDQFLSQFLEPEVITVADDEGPEPENAAMMQSPPPKPKRMKRVAPPAPRKAKVAYVASFL